MATMGRFLPEITVQLDETDCRIDWTYGTGFIGHESLGCDTPPLAGC